MSDAPSPDAVVTVAIGSPGMRAADPADVMQAIAFALRYRGRKRVDNAGEAMAWITAERLMDHLRQSGFVVMKTPVRSAGPDMHYGPSAGRPARGE